MFNNKRNNLFALKVSGDSMIDAHIDDGDYVIIRRQQTALPGQIVVAQTPDGEATLKRFFPEKSKKRIRLQPANPDMGPIYVKDCRILGVVSGVVRKSTNSCKARAVRSSKGRLIVSFGSMRRCW